MRLVHLSGELVPEDEAKISIFDSAIMLADTVTEVKPPKHWIGAFSVAETTGLAEVCVIFPVTGSHASTVQASPSSV